MPPFVSRAVCLPHDPTLVLSGLGSSDRAPHWKLVHQAVTCLSLGEACSPQALSCRHQRWGCLGPAEGLLGEQQRDPKGSRKATGLQGRPVCEPERFTGLPRAQGSLLSGQSPAGPSCVASGSYLPAASPDPHRPVNSRLRLLAGEIQCFCKSQKFLDFPIPCLWL